MTLSRQTITHGFLSLAKRTRKSTQVMDLRFVWPPTSLELR